METKSDASAKAEVRCDTGLINFYTYAIFFTIIYALFIGFKMEGILASGGTIPTFIKASHVHVLTNAFLLLFIAYDLRIKCATGNTAFLRGLSEKAAGFGLLGHLIATAGFSIAGLYPAMTAIGLKLSGIGLPVLFFGVFAYVLISVAGEMYK